MDIGSSALKAVVFDAGGRIAAASTQPLSTAIGPDGSQEQDPAQWWSALKSALAALPARDSIAALAFTGSMQNLVALDGNGQAIAPAALYSDRRLDEEEVRALVSRLPDDYAQRTGNRLDPAHTILKLMCRERFVPGAASRPDIHWTFGAKDAVTSRLTGRAAIDPTTASTTGLMNISSRIWDEALTTASGVDPAALPEIMAADAVVGSLLPAPARELGLPAGIPVFNGAGDAAAATWGALADSPGAAYAYLGTTGWVAATLSMADAAPPRDIYTLADPLRADRAIIISPFLTAGAALDWAAELTGKPVAALLDAAAAEDEEPCGMLFLPYLCGERAPFEDKQVRGAFLGLDRSHGPGAVARAVMEGIAFAVRHNLETAGLPSSPLTLIGGAARHPAQQQILADVLGREMRVAEESREMTALGVLRMVAGKAGIRIEEGALAAARTVMPRTRLAERLEGRYRTYLAASHFAREHAKWLR